MLDIGFQPRRDGEVPLGRPLADHVALAFTTLDAVAMDAARPAETCPAGASVSPAVEPPNCQRAAGAAARSPLMRDVDWTSPWTIGLGLAGMANLAHAAWMLLDPAGWYTGLPAAVPDTGPLNAHPPGGDHAHHAY